MCIRDRLDSAYAAKESREAPDGSSRISRKASDGSLRHIFRQMRFWSIVLQHHAHANSRHIAGICLWALFPVDTHGNMPFSKLTSYCSRDRITMLSTRRTIVLPVLSLFMVILYQSSFDLEMNYCPPWHQTINPSQTLEHIRFQKMRRVAWILFVSIRAD